MAEKDSDISRPFGADTTLGARRRMWGLPIVISPDDPDEFLHELRQRAHQRTGKWPLVS